MVEMCRPPKSVGGATRQAEAGGTPRSSYRGSEDRHRDEHLDNYLSATVMVQRGRYAEVAMTADNALHLRRYLSSCKCCCCMQELRRVRLPDALLES